MPETLSSPAAANPIKGYHTATGTLPRFPSVIKEFKWYFLVTGSGSSPPSLNATFLASNKGNVVILLRGLTNRAGTNQKRSFTLVGDELALTGSAAASGGTAHVVWKRAK